MAEPIQGLSAQEMLYWKARNEARSATADERERCAQLVEEYEAECGPLMRGLAAKIRAGEDGSPGSVGEPTIHERRISALEAEVAAIRSHLVL